MLQDIQVLHVDDDPAFRDLTAEFLEQVDGAITVVSESDPTVVPSRVQTEPIDCVVSDLEMPQRDGFELCRLVRAEHATLPFVLFTNCRGEEVVEGAIEAGATDYLQKKTGTHHYTLLANRIRLLVSRHRAIQKLAEHDAGGAERSDGLGFSFE